MRVPSTFTTPQRRAPQQARAALRRARFLEVAEQLIGQHGYDAVTMTAIAEQAGASIGTLYDYFPDKQSIALALMARYAEEKDAQWKALLENSGNLTRTALADLFVEGTLRFMRERPAYLPLMGAPVAYARSKSRRRPLRMTIARALQTMNPKLTDDRAFIHAEVIVQLIKGLLAVYKEAVPKERDRVAEEFKKLMRLYLMESQAAEVTAGSSIRIHAPAHRRS
jgi:AcrR family transcriptional regulator